MTSPSVRLIIASLSGLWVLATALRAADAPGGSTAPAVVLHALDEPDAERDARVAWHQEARFGCFMHWGVYSAIGGEWPGVKPGTYSEHLMRWAKIPRAEYLEKVAKPFDPEKFDAEAWVRLLRDTGMRYLIITAKHHDGFAMWPSKVSPYNLTTVSQFKRDPMAELSAACKEYGLKFGFYYSHAFDWEYPDAPGNDWDYDNPGGDKSRDDPSWWRGRRSDFLPRARRYVNEKSIPQIRELIATYHPDILWFDTPSKLPPEENRRILEAVRAADPHVVVNGRLLGNYGDYKNTADRPAEIPFTDGHWEGIPTTNDSYGWSRVDHGHKPPEHFIQLLAKIVSKGGNMLLNVGPMGTGEIDPKDVSILRGIGAWMQKNSASIYGCDRTPLAVQGWGTSTLNPKTHTLYLHVFQWPADGKLLVAGLKSDPTAARLLGGLVGVAYGVRRVTPDDLEISVPTRVPDATDSVVELTFAGAIVANNARYIPAAAPTTLHVFDGWLHGKGMRYADGKRDRDCTEAFPAGGAVNWRVRLVAPARYRVAINYATAAKTAGDADSFSVEFGAQKISGQVAATDKPTVFRTDALGEVDLPAGECIVAVRPVKLAGGDLMRLRQLVLIPVAK